MGAPHSRYVVDPADPRLPALDVWRGLSPEEQRAVLAALPTEFDASEAAPPEGDPHLDAVIEARDVLRGYIERSGRSVYVGNNLPVYYPGERMFAPDVFAVLDVEPRSRNAWTVVSEGGKGLDLAIEILVSGSRIKDFKENVERYARLGIAEYFIFDLPRQRLSGYRLASPAARAYAPVLPQQGVYGCAVLGLDLVVEGGRLRFLLSGAVLPETRELLGRATSRLDEALSRAEDAERRASDATRERDEEASRRREIEVRLAEALAEIERLRGGRG